MRKILLTLTILISLSTHCLAANWGWIHSNANRGFFFDKDSIVYEISEDKKNINKDILYVWFKTVYDPAYAYKHFHRYDIVYCLNLYAFNFRNNKIRVMRTLHYTRDGETTLSYTKPTKWKPIIPDSVGEHLRDYARKYAKEHAEEIEHRTYGIDVIK